LEKLGGPTERPDEIVEEEPGMDLVLLPENHIMLFGDCFNKERH